ncbi:dephospho-CoA kinase [Bifidobacterium imperatoris]|nr:dephospho-CoA kinase [Bifidobacterium imperatoris]
MKTRSIWAGFSRISIAIMRIGLTGGIAAGKSTVSARFAELGAVIIDYDALAHRIVEPGGEALTEIAEVFGPEALLVDGTLNRAWMADHVFGAHARPGARERLDAIEHPLIYRLAAQQEQTCTSSDIIIHDVPLLAEVIDSIPFSFDHIITVEAPVCMRLDRMIEERGMSLEQAEGRIRHQSSESERRAIADIVIDSAQPMAKMMVQVDGIYQRLLGQIR